MVTAQSKVGWSCNDLTILVRIPSLLKVVCASGCKDPAGAPPVIFFGTTVNNDSCMYRTYSYTGPCNDDSHN